MKGAASCSPEGDEKTGESLAPAIGNLNENLTDPRIQRRWALPSFLAAPVRRWRQAWLYSGSILKGMRSRTGSRQRGEPAGSSQARAGGKARLRICNHSSSCSQVVFSRG